MIRRTFSILVLALLAACASTPNQLDEDQAPRSRYSGQAGESPVGVIPEGTIRDEERGRELVFTVEYPTKPGSYPLIIFSHGFGATRNAYVGLSSHWASQGYVVIKPAHADSGRLQAGNAAQDWRDQTQTDWRNRVRDVTMILDSFDRIEEAYPELKGKVDRAKIAVGGHSYGAFIAMLIGGARARGTSYADPRVKAIVAMSPQGASETFGLTNESWANVRVPTLFMTGTNDRGIAEDETPEWRRQAFEHSPDGDKWLVVLEGAGHASFTGRIDVAPPTRAATGPMLGDDFRRPGEVMDQTRRDTPREGRAGMNIRYTFNNIKAISLAFLDAYLRGEAEGRTTLENAAQRGGVELQRK
ncbi:MAG TPA: alpha/beta fold hydrolase [Thermoanaerobaculia bacterium]|nr:alpha/beta fold hydrolase [Thermoanaerobaculia bacterium]